jgi:hypothetical protein
MVIVLGGKDAWHSNVEEKEKESVGLVLKIRKNLSPFNI